MRILCVCNNDTCRAPMFAAALSGYYKEYGRSHEVESAGYWWLSAKRLPAASEWERLQEETNINLSQHRSRWVRDVEVHLYNRIYCMDRRSLWEVEKLNIHPVVEVILANSPEGILDPWQKGLDAYRACYAEIISDVAAIPPDK